MSEYDERDPILVVDEWLDDDEHLRIPMNDWGAQLYAALRRVVELAKEAGL